MPQHYPRYQTKPIESMEFSSLCPLYHIPTTQNSFSKIFLYLPPKFPATIQMIHLNNPKNNPSVYGNLNPLAMVYRIPIKILLSLHDSLDFKTF
jgi:hypothetical protein